MAIQTKQTDEIKLTNHKIFFRLRQLAPYLGFIVLMLLFSVTTNGKFSRISNLMLIMKQSTSVLIGALGVTFVMAHGNMDFSLGGNLAICSLIGWFACSVNPYLFLPVSILVAVVVSTIMAIIHTRLQVPVFTAGICIMFIGKSILLAFGSSNLMMMPTEYLYLDTIQFYITISLIFIVLSYLFFHKSKIGRYNMAIGDNDRAALFSGIDVEKAKVIAFMISGFMVGIASFIIAIRSGGVSPQTGGTYEMDVLLALVLGGISLSGGSSVNVRNPVIGSFTYFMLNNGLTLWGVSSEIIYMIKGLLFLVMVAFSYDKNSGKEIF